MHNTPNRTGHRRTQRGFTLVELLVVLFIIGLLATLMAPSFLGYFRQTARKQAMSDLTNTIRLGVHRATNRREARKLVIEFERGTYSLAPVVKERRYGDDKPELRRVLPDRIRFVSVYYPETQEVIEDDTAVIRFRPNGTTDDAEVILAQVDENEADTGYMVMTIQGTTGMPRWEGYTRRQMDRMFDRY